MPARIFPNLLRGLVGISDLVLADHLALYARWCDELDAIDAVAPGTAWRAPATVPPAVVRRLLAMPVRDLKLSIEDRLHDLLVRIRDELTVRGITWVPGFYLGDGDFWTTDRATSINIPWYLANDALWEMVNAAETRYSEPDLMRILRHEVGHAIGYAFELWRDGHWRVTFGDFDAPYEDGYTPDPASTDHVRNLHHNVSAPLSHYAQKHADEDWAETFAVWLDPGSRWREEYATWPGALAKLLAVDDMLANRGMAYGTPVNRAVGRRVPYGTLTYTVGEFLGSSSGPSPADEARRRSPAGFNAVALHDLYFGGLSRGAGIDPSEAFCGAAAAAYGSIDGWAADFRQAARACGTGWALTVWDPTALRIRNTIVAGQNVGVPAGCPVLLALDLFEHSYAADHGIRVADYVAAWFQNILWTEVERRMLRASPDLEVGM